MPQRVDTIVAALRSLGGQARPAEIAEEIRRLFSGPHPYALLQSVRARLQENSSSSHLWQRKQDLFYSVHGIGGGVWGLREMDLLDPTNDDGFSDDAETLLADETAEVLRTHLRRERSRELVTRFKSGLQTFACIVCGFDFARRYGEIGHQFIEAHHIVPVSKLEPGTRTRLEDLAPVCSNCHRMLHRNAVVSIDELRAMLRPI